MVDTKLAIHGGTPVRANDKQWPQWPVFDDTERRGLLEVFDAGKWWFGEQIEKFEKAYAAFQDARYCVACASGTSALEVALRVLGVGHDDEVIVPPYTFIATASAVMWVGATPVFVDVDDSWNIDPDLVEAAITPRTRAIIPVHFGGNIADMDRLNAIAEKHGLAVLEDACHSWGGKWKGKGTGALGIGGAFSFQFSKNITAAEGGAIVSDGSDFAEGCRSVRNCGRGRTSGWYGHVRLGTNSRITELQAALLNAQLARLEDQTRLREHNARILDDGLAEIEGLTPQPGDDRMTRRPYHLYCLRIDPDKFGCSREQFIQAAKAEGLPIDAGYGCPLYQQPVFQNPPCEHDYTQYSCPVAEDLCSRSGMWIFHSVLLGTESDMNDIVEIARKIKKHAAELNGGGSAPNT